MSQNTFQEEELSEKSISRKILWRLIRYLKPYRSWVIVAFFLILCTSFFRQATPYLTKIGIDEYILEGDTEGLNYIILLLLLFLILQFITNYFERFITKMAGQWSMYDIRAAIFSHTQRLPLKFFDRMPIGRLMTRNTNDVDALNELFTEGIVASFSDLFTVLAIIGYIFYMDSDLALIICLTLPVTFYVTFWFQSRLLRAFRTARVHLSRLNSFLQENISGMAVVQLFNRENTNRKKFDAVNTDYLNANLESTFYYSLFYPITEFIASAITALVIWYGSSDVIRSQIDWGILVAMLQYIPRFFMPIMDIAERYGILQSSMASAERIFELLDTDPEPTGGDIFKDKIEGQIEFRNVWFAYNDDEWVLKDISFTIEPGQSVAIVGATGSGKTTIVSLLGGFYLIQKGQILIDQVDIHEWNIESLRKRIGVVQQDVFLFSGTIEDNIRFGDTDITDERIRKAAHDVNADRFIDHLELGYAHLLTERGSTISSGQRQLLAFARALAAEPDIMILDEATANVDTETELWIQDAVERLMTSRTSIVIAHRLSTIRKADIIIVLHKGVLREKGTHEKLVAENGIYRRLHQLQYSDV